MSEGDSMILGYLKDYTLPKIKYTDTSNKNSRAKNRPPALFSLYPNPQSVSTNLPGFYVYNLAVLYRVRQIEYSFRSNT